MFFISFKGFIVVILMFLILIICLCKSQVFAFEIIGNKCNSSHSHQGYERIFERIS